MTLKDWYYDRVVEGEGWYESLYELYLGMWRRTGQVWNYGTPIWEYEWDVLLILDACRYDLMVEVSDEYDWIDSIDSGYSVGSTSPEWMSKTFRREYSSMSRRTSYVTGNLFTETDLDESLVAHLDEVWRYAWDDELNTVKAESMTDRAIEVWRNTPYEKMIVHYMQPHHPYVEDPIGSGMVPDQDEYDPDVWDILRYHDDLSMEDIWPRYLDNLEYVLDSVEVLLENIDADDVLITADHGNLVGEFGLYGHPEYVPLPGVKQVPLVTTSASDVGSYQPSLDSPTREMGDREEKLQDLGYL